MHSADEVAVSSLPGGRLCSTAIMQMLMHAATGLSEILGATSWRDKTHTADAELTISWKPPRSALPALLKYYYCFFVVVLILDVLILLQG